MANNISQSQLLGQFLGRLLQAGQTTGQTGVEAGQELLQAIGRFGRGFKSGTQAGYTGQQLNPLTPMQSEALEKSLTKSLNSQADYAVETMGVQQAEQLLNSATGGITGGSFAPGERISSTGTPELSPETRDFLEQLLGANQTTPQGQTATKPNMSENIIQGLLAATEAYGGYKPGELQQGYKEKQLGIKGKEMELAGELPLQKGEREKLEIQYSRELEKAKLSDMGAYTKPLTPEQSVKFSMLVEGKNATIAIDKLLGDNVTKAMFAQSVPNFLKSTNGKLLESAILRAVEMKLRGETGASFKESEVVGVAKRYMPRTGDSLKTALRRLRPLYDYYNESINIADPLGIHQARSQSQGTEQTTNGWTSEKEARYQELLKKKGK